MRKILLLLCLTLAGCKTRMVVVETVRTDTLLNHLNTRDSIFLHDSIFVHEWSAGETIYV